jgi:two-component system phosphate regulon sensor histidine kinase PhoR
MSTQAERAGVALTSSAGAEKLPHIVADPMRLQQVFINLVHNAIKFTPPGGEIHIAGEVSGENLLFSVSDTGTGIPDEEQERIFERFYKTDRSRASGGTGLGLSIARHIVEAHNGRIWVQSREGRGSVFFIEIPASLAA